MQTHFNGTKRESHTLCRIQGCAVHRDIKKVGWGAISSFLHSLFHVNEIRMVVFYHTHVSILDRQPYRPNRFRCKDNNVDLGRVQPHCYRMREVRPNYELSQSVQQQVLSLRLSL